MCPWGSDIDLSSKVKPSFICLIYSLRVKRFTVQRIVFKLSGLQVEGFFLYTGKPVAVTSNRGQTRVPQRPGANPQVELQYYQRKYTHPKPGEITELTPVKSSYFFPNTLDQVHPCFVFLKVQKRTCTELPHRRVQSHMLTEWTTMLLRSQWQRLHPVVMKQGKMKEIFLSHSYKRRFCVKFSVLIYVVSYRQAGVRNGMFFGKAKQLCPSLVSVPYDFEAYKEVAFTMYETLAR